MIDKLISFDIYTWIVVPLLIFFARIVDVSMGTIRIILVAKGSKTLPPILGFIEIMVWLLAISQVFQRLDNILYFAAYAMGFAAGNYVGIIIEERIGVGNQVVRLITRDVTDILPMALRDEGYGVTTVEAKGATGHVHIILTVVPRKDVNKVIEIAKKIDKNIFVSVQDVRSVKAGYIPSRESIALLKRITKKKG